MKLGFSTEECIAWRHRTFASLLLNTTAMAKLEHEEKRRWATGLFNLTEISSQGKYSAFDDAFT